MDDTNNLYKQAMTDYEFYARGIAIYPGYHHAIGKIVKEYIKQPWRQRDEQAFQKKIAELYKKHRMSVLNG